MELLCTLENLNLNTSFRQYHIQIADVLTSLNELEQLLQLRYSSHLPELDSGFIKLIDGRYEFNSLIFQYIENYSHITTDKKIRMEIKTVSMKLAAKYKNYFIRYNATH